MLQRLLPFAIASALGLAAAGPGVGILHRQSPAPRAATDSLAPWARYFSGSWRCAGAFASGKPLAADLAFTPVLAGRWLEFHHTDRAPGRYEARALWGPLPADTARLVAVVHDNFGGQRRFVGEGPQAIQGPQGRAVTLVRDSTDTGARPERFRYEALSDSTFRYTWELRRQPGGPWVLGDSLTCRRS